MSRCLVFDVAKKVKKKMYALCVFPKGKHWIERYYEKTELSQRYIGSSENQQVFGGMEKISKKDAVCVLACMCRCVLIKAKQLTQIAEVINQ